MLYQKPYMEIIVFKTEDVICASYEDGDADSSSGSGSWAPPTN